MNLESSQSSEVSKKPSSPKVPEEVLVHKLLQTINYLRLLDKEKVSHMKVILTGKKLHVLNVPSHKQAF